MNQALADALEKRGYETLTPVQLAVTESELGNADLLVSAQTGSGKTVGFGLAIAPTLLGDEVRFPNADKPLALVIAPTRELALQVKRELAWLYAETGAVVASCVGGMDMRDERRALARGAHIVVATPGRLRDHIMRGSLEMGSLRAVVLDEADEMLDLGFRDDLEYILAEAPEDRRTLMFSATVPRAIVNLAKNYQNDAVRIVTKGDSKQHSDIEYRAMNVSVRDGENAIINVLRYYEAPNALVFCNTRAMVNRMTTRFSNRGFSVVALSGELTQNERSHALQSMRDGRARVCVATDVAARGIDLPNLELVIHADLPTNSEIMLHRSGRTGRAGRKGTSVLIVPPKARRKAESLLRTAKVTAAWSDAPSAEAVIERDEERMLADPVWEQTLTETEVTSAQKLTDKFDHQTIAAAYLRLFNDRQSAPEDLSPAGKDAPRPRSEFGPTVWFSVAGGRAVDAEPRRLLPMLCKVGDITKDDIGAIRIQQDESFVEIKKDAVAGFLKAVGSNMKVEDGAKLTQLAKPPAIARSPRPDFKARPKGDRKPYKGNDDRKPYKGNDDRKPYKGKDDRQPRRDFDKPKRENESYQKPQNDAAPIDWNDDPAPRHKKPKNAPKGGKPRSDDRPKRRDGGTSDYKPRRDSEGGKPRYQGKPDNGSAPTVGKPSSKKNRARAVAAKSAKSAPKFASDPSKSLGDKRRGSKKRDR